MAKKLNSTFFPSSYRHLEIQNSIQVWLWACSIAQDFFFFGVLGIKRIKEPVWPLATFQSRGNVNCSRLEFIRTLYYVLCVLWSRSSSSLFQLSSMVFISSVEEPSLCTHLNIILFLFIFCSLSLSLFLLLSLSISRVHDPLQTFLYTFNRTCLLILITRKPTHSSVQQRVSGFVRSFSQFSIRLKHSFTMKPSFLDSTTSYPSQVYHWHIILFF